MCINEVFIGGVARVILLFIGPHVGLRGLVGLIFELKQTLYVIKSALD
jgi:hypothetical protein